MANDDSVRSRGGLLPVQFPFGNFKKEYYRLTTGVAACNIFIGMPVDLDATGRAIPIELTTSGNYLLGSVVGFADTNLEALPSAMETTNAGAYLPGNTDAFVLVATDPNQDFILQEDTGGTALTLSEVGNNANMVYRSTSGDTTTGYATVELDRSSAGTGTGGVLVIKQLGRQMNSDGTQNGVGNYGKWVVGIARHRFGNAQFQGGQPI